MSKVGSTPIPIPEKVTVTISHNSVKVAGIKGELTQSLPANISVIKDQGQLLVSRKSESKADRSLHGLIRSLIYNMIHGVTHGFKKHLELVGTGYRVAKDETGLTLSLGFSHPVKVSPLDGISFDIEGNNKITVSGIDKQVVGEVAAKIRSLKKPEVYKGKGIRYLDEVVRLKPGKAAKVGAAGE